MPVLGVGGKLVLRREAPEPCILSADQLNTTNDTFVSICPGYWSGDHIAANCLPVNTPGVLPGDPEGWATYFGSKWFLGPNRDHITAANDAFYKTAAQEYPDGQAGDAAQFYAREGDVSDGDVISGCTPNDFWIHIDQLGQVSFYDSRCKALAGCPGDRLDLVATNEDIVIAPYGRLEYQNAVWECYAAMQGAYEFSDVRNPITLISICADAPRYEIPVANPNTEAYAYDNANILPRGSQQQQAPYWQCVADLREFSLDLSAPEVDSTAVAEKWGNAVKSLVRGGGSCEFFIDRKCFDDETTNGISLMQLLLMTEKGCKASAQFYLMQRPGECGADPCSGLIAGDLYYEADILVTQTAVNVRPTELVVGTANFVTTGEIALREAY